MKQPIAGVSPSEASEVTVMTVWPSIATYPSGQFLGRLFAIRWPNIYVFRLGNLLALLAIPHALFLYFCRIAPSIGIRYTVTNQRIVVQRGLSSVDERSIPLGDFDDIQIDVRPGQEWYHAGDLVFRLGNQEVFRLGGVSRPETFRHVCEKSHVAFTSVRQVRRQQTACA